MSATAALILMMDVTATCWPAAPTRLRAGATIVEAIVTFDPEAFDLPAPAPAGATMSVATDQRDTSPEAVAPDTGEATGQCEAVSLPIA